MSRLFRWAFNSAAVLSAVLFVGVCVLWVRSARVAEADLLLFSRGGIRWSLESRAGRVRLSNDPERERRSTQLQVASINLNLLEREFTSPTASEMCPPPSLQEQAADRFATEAAPARAELARARALVAALPPVGYSIPFAAVAAAAILLPVSVLMRLTAAEAERRLRRGRGRCLACGFDLRATPGRCPECGAVPGQAPTPVK